MGVCCHSMNNFAVIPEIRVDGNNFQGQNRKKKTEDLIVYLKENQECSIDFIISKSNRYSNKRETTKFMLKQKTIESCHTKIEDDITSDQIGFIKNVIKSNSLTPSFDEDTLEEFTKAFFVISIKKNNNLFYIDDEAKVFYIIDKGKIQLNLSDNSVLTLNEGNYFGIETFEENTFRKETAVVMEDSNLFCITGDFYRSALSYNNLKIVNTKHTLILKVPLFKFFGTEKVSIISDQLQEKKYEIGQPILIENESLFNSIYMINTGTICKTKNEKQFMTLSFGNCFGDKHIFYPNSKTEYTYTADSVDLRLYIISYEVLLKSLKFNLEEIVYDHFSRIIKNSEKLFGFLFSNQMTFFHMFVLKHYPNNHVVFSKDAKNNKKICIVLSGQLRNSNTNEIVCSESNIYGENIIDSKDDQEDVIVSVDETLILESKWEDIIKKSPNINNINIYEAVQVLKQTSLFSKLNEIQLLDICCLIGKERFKEKETILKEGVIGTKLYIIKKGTVQMFQDSKFVRRIEKKGCFGSVPEIYCDILSFTAISVGNTEFYVIDSNVVKLFDLQLKQQIKQAIFLQNVNVKLSELKNVKNLGNGRFGQVYLVHNNHQLYALKYAPLFSISKNPRSMQYYLNEKNIMIQTDNPFITKLVKTFKDNNFIYFLLEYIDGISLRKYIEQNKEKSLKELQFYSAIILSVLNYIHKKKVLHRDIKPENIMIDKNGYLKLIDFGISKILNLKDYTNTLCGTPSYLAPEIIMGEGYSYTADYWSFGITMFEIFFGYLPFGQNCKSLVGVYNEILKQKIVIPNHAKYKELSSFLTLILSKNIVQRVCNFNLLKSHEFFQGFDFEKLNKFSINAPYIPDCFVNNNIDNQVSIVSEYKENIVEYLNTLHINEIKEMGKEENQLKTNIYYQEF